MGWQLILLVMLIYGAVGVKNLMAGDYAMAIVWFGYSFSNIGLAWLDWRAA